MSAYSQLQNAKAETAKLRELNKALAENLAAAREALRAIALTAAVFGITSITDITHAALEGVDPETEKPAA